MQLTLAERASGRRRWLACALLLGTLGSGGARAVEISLFEMAFNVDGVVDTAYHVNDLPQITPIAGIDTSAFDFTSGLGDITLEFTAPGAHEVLWFSDHELDQALNTFFNETGDPTGTAAVGQTWEIDEPGYLFGDIYDNFLAGTLENATALSAVDVPDDVSIALGWSFELLADEIATITFSVSDLLPSAPFYLTHTDADSDAPNSIYFYSSLDIDRITTDVPEPAALGLLLAGLLGGVFYRSRRRLVR